MLHTNNSSYQDRWHPSQVQECVALWDLSEEEINKLMQLKEAVADVDHWKNDPFFLVRFLKTPLCHGKIKVMEHHFRHCVQWRQEHGVDTILQDYAPPILYNYSPFAVMEGCDKVGDNILVGRIGSCDNLGLLQRFGRDEAIQTFVWYYELMTRGPWQKSHLPRQGRPLRMFLVVHDLKGLNRHHLHPSLVSLTRELLHIETTLYPHYGKKLLVVNCPPIISLFWAIFKHVIPPHAREKMEFATEEHTEQLVSKYMDVTLLPKEVVPGKGKGKAVRGYDPVWEGGMLPPPSDDDWKRRGPIIIDSAGDQEAIQVETNVFSMVLMKGAWEEDEEDASGKPLVVVV